MSFQCEIRLYGKNQSYPCEKGTMTRCAHCHKWCCSWHREETLDYKVLCTDCAELRREALERLEDDVHP